MPGCPTHADAFTSTLSIDEQKAFAEYWQSYRVRRNAGEPFLLPPLERPYWMLLPEWLLRKSDNPDTKTLLREILRAQYLLFIAFRIHDDLMDEEARYPLALRSVPGAILRESSRVFDRLFPVYSIFWERYPELINETTNAISKADILQRTPASLPELLLDEYARVNSVFLAGSWAACVLIGQIDLFERVKSFADKLSRGAQILDDFYDMTEDLKRDRYNYVVNVLMRSSFRVTSEAAFVGALFHKDTLESILCLVRNYYRTAYEQLRGMEIPESSLYAEEYIKRIETIRSEIDCHLPESINTEGEFVETARTLKNSRRVCRF